MKHWITDAFVILFYCIPANPTTTVDFLTLTVADITTLQYGVKHFYLCQGGYVFVVVCMSVCLMVFERRNAI